ncbi:16552_t:CDS:2, partial [Gigaspora rosea]
VFGFQIWFGTSTSVTQLGKHPKLSWFTSLLHMCLAFYDLRSNVSGYFARPSSVTVLANGL